MQSHYADIHTQYYDLQKGLEGNAMLEIPWWEGKVGIVKWMKGTERKILPTVFSLLHVMVEYP